MAHSGTHTSLQDIRTTPPRRTPTPPPAPRPTHPHTCAVAPAGVERCEVGAPRLTGCSITQGVTQPTNLTSSQQDQVERLQDTTGQDKTGHTSSQRPGGCSQIAASRPALLCAATGVFKLCNPSFHHPTPHHPPTVLAAALLTPCLHTLTSPHQAHSPPPPAASPPPHTHTCTMVDAKARSGSASRMEANSRNTTSGPMAAHRRRMTRGPPFCSSSRPVSPRNLGTHTCAHTCIGGSQVVELRGSAFKCRKN